MEGSYCSRSYSTSPVYINSRIAFAEERMKHYVEKLEHADRNFRFWCQELMKIKGWSENDIICGFASINMPRTAKETAKYISSM